MIIGIIAIALVVIAFLVLAIKTLINLLEV